MPERLHSKLEAGLWEELAGVLGLLLLAHLEVQVGAGGVAGGAHQGDALARAHLVALPDQQAVVVGVDRGGLLVVAQDDRVPVAAELLVAQIGAQIPRRA